MTFPVTPPVALSRSTDLTLAGIELAEIGRELAELAVDREMALHMPEAKQWLAEIREQQRRLRRRAAQLRSQLADSAVESPPGGRP